MTTTQAVSKGVPPTTFQYFAYGSNMLTRRLSAADRAPSAKRIGIGYLEGRRLTFYKVSQDGSGKCDAEATAKKTDRVYGVIFEIPLTDEATLDRAEGPGTRLRQGTRRSGHWDRHSQAHDVHRNKQGIGFAA